MISVESSLHAVYIAGCCCCCRNDETHCQCAFVQIADDVILQYRLFTTVTCSMILLRPRSHRPCDQVAHCFAPKPCWRPSPGRTPWLAPHWFLTVLLPVTHVVGWMWLCLHVVLHTAQRTSLLSECLSVRPSHSRSHGVTPERFKMSNYTVIEECFSFLEVKFRNPQFWSSTRTSALNVDSETGPVFREWYGKWHTDIRLVPKVVILHNLEPRNGRYFTSSHHRHHHLHHHHHHYLY